MVGIIGNKSQVVGCAREGFPGIFTRVDKYLPWIRGIEEGWN